MNSADPGPREYMLIGSLLQLRRFCMLQTQISNVSGYVCRWIASREKVLSDSMKLNYDLGVALCCAPVRVRCLYGDGPDLLVKSNPLENAAGMEH